MSAVAVATARMPGEEHSDRNTAKVETDRIQGDGHHARFPHLVAEAGSIVSHVSNSMIKVKKSDEDSEHGEEEGGRDDEISRKDAEIRRLIELRRSTPKEEKQRMKKLSKSIKKCIRDRKDNKKSKKFSKTSKVSATSQESNLQKKKVLITKIKNERGEIITSREGIANVFGEFYKKKNFTTTMSKTKMEMKATLTCTSATLKK